MNYPITRTKVILPRRQGDLLSRDRLLQILDDLLDYRLTLITAPAGYGKTTLLVDLAVRVEVPVCWLAIDPLDEDPQRFLQYFIAAIRQVFPDFGEVSRSLVSDLEGGNPSSEQVLQTVVNDLYQNVGEHFILVLDDYHLIDHSPGVNQFINDFTQAADENCHLVISSRSLIGLPDLPLMVGRTQVKGLSFQELAFLPEEIRDLYQTKYQVFVSSDAAEDLAAATEGWITGLLLSAETQELGATGQAAALRASGVDLYDYLAQQVLEQQSPKMRDFLLRTSLLEEFNDNLCQQALGDPEMAGSWGELISELLTRNLFIQPVESGGTWLRYHHLFRDFLQDRFLTLHPERADELLHRLVDVYRENGRLEKAYAASRMIGDENLTGELLKTISPTMLYSGQLSLLKTWLDELTPALIEKTPELLVQRAAIAIILGDPDSGLQILNRALERLSSSEDSDLLAELLIRRATCQRFLGVYKSGLDDALEALKRLERTGNGKSLKAGAEREAGLNLVRLGLNKEAKVYLERSLADYLDLEDRMNPAFLQMDLGLMEMKEGKYSRARSLYKEAYSTWEESGNLSQLFSLCNNLGVLEHLTGDYREAFGWFSRGLDFARQTSNRRATAFTLASLADLALDLGSLSRAEAYMDEAKEIAENIRDSFLLTYISLSRASLSRLRKEYAEAEGFLNAASRRIPESSSGEEKGRYHLERGLISAAQDQIELSYREFQTAGEIYAAIQLPVETCLAFLYQAGAACLQGKKTDADSLLEDARESIRSLGMLNPLVPGVTAGEQLWACLIDHLSDDPLLKDLLQEVADFQSRIPSLLKDLEFDRLPFDISHEPLLDIQALGRINVNKEGEPITAPEWTKQRTVRELFFYLLNCPEGASREEICYEFWPDSLPEQLQKQFKNALYRLRKAVGRESILYDQVSRLYTFNRGLDYRYDVEDFEGAVLVAEGESELENRIELLQEAVDRYQHPFAPSLEGVWTEAVRYQLYLAFERTTLRLAGDQLSAGRPDSCLESTGKLLSISPGQEAACRLEMKAHAEKGNRSAIERTYQRCCQALAEDLNLEPSGETTALYQQLTT